MARRKKERRGRGIPVRTPSTRDDFLTMIANGKSITAACEWLEISRSAVHKWIREDETFSDAYNEALEMANDRIRDEVDRRAIRGVRRIRYSGGRWVNEREYSDRLLEKMMTARLPEYKEKEGPGVVVNNNTMNVVQLTEEQLMQALKDRNLPMMAIDE